MRNVVIVAACRTPIGTIGGQFKSITSLDLSIPVMQALVEKSQIKPELIDDVIYGDAITKELIKKIILPEWQL